MQISTYLSRMQATRPLNRSAVPMLTTNLLNKSLIRLGGMSRCSIKSMKELESPAGDRLPCDTLYSVCVLVVRARMRSESIFSRVACRVKFVT